MKKLVLMSMAILALSSCQKETDNVVDTPTTSAPTIEAPSIETTPDVITDANVGDEVQLQIGGTDAMTYTKNELRVPAGSKVTLTLTHEGEMDKKVMGHNWVLLKQGTDIQAFATEAMKAVDSDYIPANDPAIIAHTDLVGGGESSSVTFDAPAPGTYEYICSFPGHYGNMKGTLIVE